MPGVVAGLCLWAGSAWLAGCQGALTLTQPGVTNDLSVPADQAVNETPATIGFADIERDFEKGNFGCANGSGVCHGGTKPTGVMMITPNSLQNPTALKGNYDQVMSRLNLGMPDQSLLLQKTLTTSSVSHGGIKPFNNALDANYSRWLLWISLGAPFDPVSTSGQGDM